MLGRGEAFEGGETREVLLFAVEVEERDTGLETTEGLVDVSDLFGGGEEDQSLTLQVRLDEGPQYIQLFVEGCDDVVLLQTFRDRERAVGV